jgi:hypothetical protein
MDFVLYVCPWAAHFLPELTLAHWQFCEQFSVRRSQFVLVTMPYRPAGRCDFNHSEYQTINSRRDTPKDSNSARFRQRPNH